ncbi:class I SAM-dependent methyltransferase [Candidatus Entotheonella palauensis]|uniref:SAM-dependent methyltransferase n=1 Tax=Candidatus Entotheonella gemina TaxID=1429439 RepID=W4MFS9_9BACT|nr:class I SAM-dependent methyltransferase [Candidatus Entotheonella palauensis]ETX09184.1 MAG: SAM-dependent methyltransferase [Candidatus Entotheonella gemina]
MVDVPPAMDAPPAAHCRFCNAILRHTFVNLGSMPLVNAYLRRDQLGTSEVSYPLHVYVCEQCFLVQHDTLVPPGALFNDYAYFSSYSDTWLLHAKAYADMIVNRLGLGPRHQVVEIGSNDGYLLQYIMGHGVPVLGVEPAANVAEVAQQRGVPTRIAFFGAAMAADLAAEGFGADLLIGNNVLAHIPNLNDCVQGLACLLNPQGVITMEFPHVMRLMAENQFDTIYHEHFFYFSLLTVERVFAAHGLTIFDVEELPTHGGSLRIFARHAVHPSLPIEPQVNALKAREIAAGLSDLPAYKAFAHQVEITRREVRSFLLAAKRAGKHIVAYGAAAKGNTLLNASDIADMREVIDYVVDRNPYKQGRFLPGTHLPVQAPEHIRETRPDYLLILPWNVKDEIMQQMAHIRAWGGQFAVAIPKIRIYD